MGGGGSKQKKEKPSKNQPAIGNEWDLSTRTDTGAIYRDRNGREAEEEKFFLDNRYDPSHQFEIYEQRRKTNLPLVKAYGAQFKNTGGGLAPKNEFRAMTQRIPHRLCSVPQLTYPQSLYVLQESLKGYSHLYEKAGAFNVNNDMIGFTPQGETKVWFNENFGQNHPSSQKHILQSTLQDRSYLTNQLYNLPVNQDEASMVRNIVEVIEDKCQEGQYPDENFRRLIYRDRLGFEEARNIVRDTYIQNHFVQINHLDFYNNWIHTRSSRQDQHIISRPEQFATTHHQSYVRPVQTHSHLVNNFATQNVVSRPVQVSYDARPSANYHQTSYVQPTVTTGAHFSNSYKPMQTAKKNTVYMFNYQQPKEYFHPDMYAGRA